MKTSKFTKQPPYSTEKCPIIVLCHVANEFITSLTPNESELLRNRIVIRKNVALICCSLNSCLQSVLGSLRKLRQDSQNFTIKMLEVKVDVFF